MADHEHQWVKIEMCPVEVLKDDAGEPVIIVDPEAQAQATEDTSYGCLTCDASLVEGADTLCPGA